MRKRVFTALTRDVSTYVLSTMNTFWTTPKVVLSGLFFFLILQSFLAVISALERFATHAGGTCSFVPSVMACVIPTLCHGSWLLKNKSYKYEALWILYLHWTHSQGVSKLAHGLNFARFNWVGKVTEVNWDFYTPATQKVKAGWNWKDERKINKTVLDWSPSHGVTKNCTIRHCDKNSLAVLNKNTVSRQHEGDEVSGVASSLCGTIMLIPFMCAARAA